MINSPSPKKQKKTFQNLTCKIEKSVYNDFEIKCFEKQTKINRVLKKAVYEFLEKKQ